MDPVGAVASKEDPFGHITSRDLRPEHLQVPDSTVFKAVLYYCVLVLGGPIVAFFGTRYLILVPLFQWGTEDVKTNVVSAIVAVVVLHIALGLFIMRAYFNEDDAKKKIGKRD